MGALKTTPACGHPSSGVELGCGSLRGTEMKGLCSRAGARLPGENSKPHPL